MKKNILFLLGIMSCSLFHVFGQKPGSFKQLYDGVIVYPAKKLSGQAAAVKVCVISDQIVRVIASPSVIIDTQQSLSVIVKPTQTIFTLEDKGDSLWVVTKKLRTLITKTSGTVSFFSLGRERIFWERDITGREIQPAVFDGKKLFRLRQTFETLEGDAIYGLGQHQEDVWNYMGKQVVLFQNNTEVAIPFFVSPKNYAILWDNYSYTVAGDTRNFLPISHLKLFDKIQKLGTSYVSDTFKERETDLILKLDLKGETAYLYALIEL